MVELTLKVLLFRFQIEQTVPTKNLIKNLIMLPVTREAPLSSNIALVQQLRMLLLNSTQTTAMAIQIPPRWE